MRPTPLALALALSCATAWSQQPGPTADSIMARVAANQDRSDAERLHYVYTQHARIASRKGKTLMCEEITDSRVTPSEQGSTQAILKLDGKLLSHKKYIAYTHLPAKNPGETHVASEQEDINIGLDSSGETDRDLVENMRHNLTNDQSRDGIGAKLFPLTSKYQGGYRFHLLGRENRNGRDVFHIAFEPKDKDEYVWKGDAYIDTTAYQPVLVRTAMARNVPFAVRTLLGTSLPGLGFTIVYAPQPDGVWFPTTFGTEFKLHVLFFFTRQITISAENRDFAKTHVTSQIIGDATPPLEPSPAPTASPQ